MNLLSPVFNCCISTNKECYNLDGTHTFGPEFKQQLKSPCPLLPTLHKNEVDVSIAG